MTISVFFFFECADLTIQIIQIIHPQSILLECVFVNVRAIRERCCDDSNAISLLNLFSRVSDILESVFLESAEFSM